MSTVTKENHKIQESIQTARELFQEIIHHLKKTGFTLGTGCLDAAMEAEFKIQEFQNLMESIIVLSEFRLPHRRYIPFAERINPYQGKIILEKVTESCKFPFALKKRLDNFNLEPTDPFLHLANNAYDGLSQLKTASLCLTIDNVWRFHKKER